MAFKTMPVCFVFTLSACDPISDVHSRIPVLGYLSVQSIFVITWGSNLAQQHNCSLSIFKTVVKTVSKDCSSSLKVWLFFQQAVDIWAFDSSYLPHFRTLQHLWEPFFFFVSWGPLISFFFCLPGALGFQVATWKWPSLFLVCSSQW